MCYMTHYGKLPEICTLMHLSMAIENETNSFEHLYILLTVNTQHIEYSHENSTFQCNEKSFLDYKHIGEKGQIIIFAQNIIY